MPKARSPFSGPYHKRTILSLVERRGMIRSFHVEGARSEKISPIVRANLAREALMMTDESRSTPSSTTSSRLTSLSITAKKNTLDTPTFAYSPWGAEFVIHTHSLLQRVQARDARRLPALR